MAGHMLFWPLALSSSSAVSRVMSSTGTSTLTSIVFSRPASTIDTCRSAPPRKRPTSSSGRWVAATPLRLGRDRLSGEAVEAPQEGGQSLAAAGGSGHEGVAAGSHLPPASLLHGGRLGEGGSKPVAHGRREKVQRVPHRRQFDHCRDSKQVFLTPPHYDPLVFDTWRFREVMARFASGVVVLTAFGEDGGPRGLTVSAFCAASLEPPLALVCIDKTSNTLPAVQHTGGFTANILASGREQL